MTCKLTHIYLLMQLILVYSMITNNLYTFYKMFQYSIWRGGNIYIHIYQSILKDLQFFQILKFDENGDFDAEKLIYSKVSF